MNLAEFARWAVQNGPFDGVGLDGSDIQDKALECGILEQTEYDPKVHGANNCDAEKGNTWYVFSDELKKSLRSAVG